MKRFLSLALLISVMIVGCDKSEINKVEEQGALPVTNAVKTGDWMIIYYENGVSMDMGLVFLKFNTGGTVAATKDGANYNGTWTETNKGGVNTLQLNIATTDVKLLKANKTWQVTNTSEYYIDLKDMNTASNATVLLMKH